MPESGGVAAPQRVRFDPIRGRVDNDDAEDTALDDGPDDLVSDESHADRGSYWVDTSDGGVLTPLEK